MKTTGRYAPKGYTYVDKQLARVLFSLGFEVTFHLNNINSAHVFGGWRLGVTYGWWELTEELDHEAWNTLWDDAKTRGEIYDGPYPMASPEKAWDACVDNYVSYNRGELGRYPVFCVTTDDYSLYLDLRNGIPFLNSAEYTALADKYRKNS